MQCPECRQKHLATKKEKSFPQNKYILVNIKRRPTSKEEDPVSPKLPEVDLCEKHNRPRSLFCMEQHCQKLICHLCLKNEHRGHEFEEAEQILEEKRNILVDNVKLLRGNLLVDKRNLQIAKEDAQKNRKECIEKIEKARDEQIRMMTQLFDQMIAKVNDNFTDVRSSIDKKTGQMDNNLFFLADIDESTKTMTSVRDILEMISTVNMMEKNIGMFAHMDKFKHCHYCNQMLTTGELQKMTGSLDLKDAQVDMKPLDKLSLSPKTPTLKTINSASELKLEGN